MTNIGIFNQTNEKLDLELTEVKNVLDYAIKKENLKNIEFNVIIVNNSLIHDLNNKYRHIDKATDVITFALEDEKEVITGGDMRVLGDIYISIDKAKGQAMDYGHSLVREVCFLAVHGFYHLLGYDHMNVEDEKVMFQKQEEVLSGYGIKR